MRSVRTMLGALGLCALLGATGCQSPAPAPASGPAKLKAIFDSGELRVGITADQPPLSMKNAQGEFVGFEIDVVEALAGAMRLDVRFLQLPFQDLLPAIERGDVDLVISGLTITPERNARVAFVGPYFISGASLLSKSEALANAQSTQELDDPDRTYVTLADSTSEQFVAEQMPRAKHVITADYEAGVQMVLDDRADALVADYLVCKAAAWRHPEADLRTMRTPFTIEPLGIALPADASLLLNLVDNYLNTLEYTGLLGRFKARWLADGAWMEDPVGSGPMQP